MGRSKNPAFFAFLYSTILVGLIAATSSLLRLIEKSTDYQWGILVLITALTSYFTVKIPEVNSKISVGDTFVFTNLILFGPEAGVVTAALDGLVGSLRLNPSWRRLRYNVFNVAAMAASVWCAGKVFFWILGRAPVRSGGPVTVAQILFPTAVLALVHYVINTGSVAAIVALESRKSIWGSWRENFLWTWLTYFSGAAVAALIGLNSRIITPAVLGVMVPVLLLVYFSYKTYLERVWKLNDLYINTVETLAMAIDAKDQTTHGHVRRVQVYARGLARAAGIVDETVLHGIEAAALLHDIGKLAIPGYILNKPGKLTRSEFQKMMIHAAVGADILSKIKFPYDVANDVRHHHENWDGTGYPNKLQGEEISLGARILAIADCYDALTCDRPYRAALDPDTAMAIIHGRSGTYYDPELVRKFEGIIGDLSKQVRDIEVSELNLESCTSVAEEGRNFDNAVPRPSPRVSSLRDISSNQREVLALYELARKLGAVLTLDETLSILGSKIAKLIPSTTCVIYLENADGALEAHHVAGANASAFQRHSMEVGESLTGWVAANRHAAVDADPVFDVAPIKNLLEQELHSALVYPLECEQECIGAIALYDSARHHFHDDHVRIMETVAQQASTAIRNARRYEESRDDAMTDRLTGLPNSRYLDVFLEREREKTPEQPFVVLVLDLDRFKSINDAYGHRVGDQVLAEVSRALEKTLRDEDILVRYGGDEFLMLMYGATMKDADAMAKRVESAVGEVRLEVREGQMAEVGVSVGVACYPEDGFSLDALFEKADRSMYRNKKLRGRSPAQGRQEPVLSVPESQYVN